jgi:DNA repair exonuclease SbcCD ATPase subunit
MAKDIQVNLKLNTKEATQSADTFAKSLDNVATEAKDAEKSLADASAKGASNFEDQLKKLNKTIKEAPVDIRKMNKQIQEYQALALNAGRNTPVGKKALMEAAQLRDKYVDIQNEVKRLSADGMRLQGALDLGSTVVGGFAAFKGVSAALGTENEELQQTFVKLQGAQSALMGIEVIRKNLEKESTLMLMRKQAAEKISLIGTKALTAANKVFNTTLKANPIAIVVTAVLALTGVIVAFADKIKMVVMPLLEPLTGVFNFLKDAVIGIGSALGLTSSKSERAMDKMNKAVIDGLEDQE